MKEVSYVHIGYRACEDLLAADRIDGAGFNAFEGSAFFLAAKTLSAAQRPADRIWLEQDGSTANAHGFQFDRHPVCRIRIIGRRAADIQRRGLSA